MGKKVGPVAPAGALQPGYESVFGVPNASVNAWGIGRRDRGRWVRMETQDESGVGRKEWPLDTLTPELVRETWGPGEYRCYWFAHDPENTDPGKRWKAEGTGMMFSVRDMAPSPEQPPASYTAPPDPLAALPGFAPALAIMGVINQQTQAQMTGMAQFAQVMAASSRQGTDPALLRILEGQNASNARIEALLARLLEEEPEDAAEPNPAAGAAAVAARAAARPLFRPGQPMGEAIRTALTNHFVENPSALVDIVKAVPAALDAISRIGKAPPAPPPRPRATMAPQVPPVVIVQKPDQPPSPPPPKRRPLGPGLNAFAADAAPSTPPTGNA
jgi:hypothetical protein